MENEIVLYQPNDAIHLEVMMANESVWLTQSQIASLFGVDKSGISRHLKNIFESEELDEALVVAKFATTTQHGAVEGKTQTTESKFYFVLERFSKKRKDVKVTIYTDPKTKLSEQDIQKFNEQYSQLTLKHTSKAHDRFLIIDNKILYHIGASLKDLGKKCFAFEVLDSAWIKEILKNL